MVSPRGLNGITPGTGGFNVRTHNGLRVMNLGTLKGGYY